MKRKTVNLGLTLVAALSLGLTACKKEGCMDPEATNYNSKAKKDDGSCTYPEVVTGNTVVQGDITSNTTWTADKIYELKGKVVVKSGTTLTIEAGTIIKGQEGSDVNATALIIARGGKIMANGTASKPIIFTSVLDNIAIGQIAGTSLDEADAGKWGGLIVLGNAPVSSANGDTESQIEGIPVTESYGTFGGSNASDDSGVLNYISIRHGGTLIGAGNEINGLTLGGVGSGTTVSNIEIIGNLDDGIEIFGGTVNVSNILVYFQQDDAIDLDMNYAGTIDNFYTVNNAGVSDKGLEIDGPEGSTNTNGMFTIKNGTCAEINGSVSYATCDFKDKAQGIVMNSILGQVKIRSNFDAANACSSKTDAYTNLVAATPKLGFLMSSFTSVLVYTSTTCSIPTDYQPTAESMMVSTTNSGGDKSVFNSWTWSSAKGKI